MTQRTNQWKLGAFVLAGVLTAIGTFFWIGAARFRQAATPLVTYFDESVQGLDQGAPVKMRGVTIGKVKRISIANQRLVRVDADIFLDDLSALGIDLPNAGVESISTNVRTQLATSGITGVKFILVDFFVDPPAPIEVDDAPRYYLPSTPSTLKGVEDTFNSLAARLPELLAGAGGTLALIEGKLDEIDVPRLVESLDSLIRKTEEQLGGLDLPGLRAAAGASLAELDATAVHARETLASLTVPEGPVDRVLAILQAVADEAASFTGLAGQAVADAKLEETAASLRSAAGRVEGTLGKTDSTLEEAEFTLASYRQLAQDVRGLPPEASEVLGDLRRTLRSLERLTALLERQPSALLRGRASETSSPNR